MPKAKNLGPCAIPECDYKNTCRFRKMTKYAIEKIRNKHSEGNYNFIKENDELCHEHYMKIIESDIHEKYKSKTSVSLDTVGNSNDIPREFSRECELDWTRIKINLVDDNVVLSKDDFRNIINHISNLKLQINESSYYINECDDDFSINNDGNYILLQYLIIVKK